MKTSLLLILWTALIVSCSSENKSKEIESPSSIEKSPEILTHDLNVFGEVDKIAKSAILEDRPSLSEGDLVLFSVNYMLVLHESSIVDGEVDLSQKRQHDGYDLQYYILPTVTLQYQESESASSTIRDLRWLRCQTAYVRVNNQTRETKVTFGIGGPGINVENDEFIKANNLVAPNIVTRSEEESIVAAILDHYFDRGGSNDSRKAFISLYGRDPSEHLLKGLKSKGYAIDYGSNFELGKGTKWSINSIVILEDGSARVGFKTYTGNLAASGNTLTLRKNDDDWTVVDVELHWISEKLPTKSEPVESGQLRYALRASLRATS